MKIEEWERVFKQSAKLFCQDTNAAFTKEFFVLALSAGDSTEATRAYAFTPEHLKRVSLMLQSQVAAYEKEHGEIATAWSPNITSPIQIETREENGQSGNSKNVRNDTEGESTKEG